MPQGRSTPPGSLLSRRTSTVSRSTAATGSYYSGKSGSSASSWGYTVPRGVGRGAVLFTGPDGLGDHRVSVEPEHRYVGEGRMSNEGTSETSYLWRAPSGMPPPRPKSSTVGEIGWGIPMFTDWNMSNNGNQIQLREFRQLCEDRHTHHYQSPWYPGPGEILPQSSDALLVMNVYKNQNQNNKHIRVKHSRLPAATPLYNQRTTWGDSESRASENSSVSLSRSGRTSNRHASSLRTRSAIPVF